MNDAVRAFLQAPAPPPFEGSQKFLRSFFSDADSIEEVKRRVSRHLRENARPIVAARRSLVALLESAEDRDRLSSLVAWDANWPLDRPDVEASAGWLKTVVDLIDACQANPNVDPPTARKRETAAIEGRIFGDPPWNRRVNYSYRWQSYEELNDVVNAVIRANWDDIKLHLAFNGIFEDTFDAGRTVGQGFVNANAESGGPPRSLLTPTNHVRLILAPAPPPDGFHIVVALPCVVRTSG